MNIICVDDEYLIVEELISQLKKLYPDTKVTGFTDANQACEYCEANQTDIAILDIDMPEMDGIELAAAIKRASRDTAIIFLTAYSEYALKAFEVHASGYLLKPIDPQRLARELSYITKEPPKRDPARIEVKTFGGFDLFVNGEPVSFKKSKCKELLAFLVDKQGSSVTRAEAFAALWEDREYDRSMQKQLDVIIRSLRSTLEFYGIDNIFSLKKGEMRINPYEISCDAYRFYSGDPEAVNSFHGEYMSAYSWANMTESYLYWKAFGKDKQ